MKFTVCGYHKRTDRCWTFRVDAVDYVDALFKAGAEEIKRYRTENCCSTPTERHGHLLGMIAVAVVDENGGNYMEGDEPYPLGELEYIDELI